MVGTARVDQALIFPIPLTRPISFSGPASSSRLLSRGAATGDPKQPSAGVPSGQHSKRTERRHRGFARASASRTRELLDLIHRIDQVGASSNSLGDPLFDTTGSQSRLLVTADCAR
jgi:hypothetical protein